MHTVDTEQRISSGRLNWAPLMRHSHHLALDWLRRGREHRGRAARHALNRALVPLDPWRYYELGALAAMPVTGRWLDVSSPKLLPSFHARRGQGTWVCTDLFAAELEAWRVIDPSLELRVEDARSLSFPDASFDGCLCVSVLEHIPGDGDTTAMAEMWRVLRPGGTLRLTTNTARTPRELTIDRAIYGEASATLDDGSVFFERHYDDSALKRRLIDLPWEVVREERVRLRHPAVERSYHRLSPASYLAGNALPLVCARNFARIDASDQLRDDEMGVVLMELRKPAADETS
jgi:SAM-dependent methyltransferase